MTPLVLFLWGVLCWTLTFLLTPAVRYLDRFNEKTAWATIIVGTHAAMVGLIWSWPGWFHLIVSGIVGGAWGVIFYRRILKPRLDLHHDRV